jgi:NAD(P)-dependent dehydrogenase (short-subunit alcohol dehydrogenase family)
MSSTASVLITGSSRGLGKGVALELARAGYSVGIHYGNNEQAALQTSSECKALAISPDQIFPPLKADLSKPQERGDLIQKAFDQLGGLDALVNNAGMAPRVRADLLEMSEESYNELMEVNLKGPLFLSQQASKRWVTEKRVSRLSTGFKLIFVTSISAYTASVNRGEYCISKAGLAMVNQLFATRLAAEGVQVVEIRPGIMQTDMTSGVKEKYDKLIEEGLVPQKRWGKPEDIALAVKAVLQGSFPFSTGDVFNVDGGFHLQRL